jgi:DNA-binding XRE family transcriptional regulator
MLKRIDWPAVIEHLLTANYTQKSLGMAIGLSQTSVYKLKSGDVPEPSDSVGQALRQLYAAHGFGLPPEFPPAQQTTAQEATETVVH